MSEDQNKQSEEESFKDKVMNSMNKSQDTSKKTAPHVNDAEKTREKIQMPNKNKNVRSRRRSNSNKAVNRKREDQIVSRIVTVIVIALIIIGGVLGYSGYKYVTDSLKPLDKEDIKLVQVNIPSGSSNKQIGNILEKDDIIKSGLIFNYYTKFKNLSGFKSGYYQFSPSMTMDEIGAALQAGGTAEQQAVADGKVTIPEGYDIDQIGDAIAKNTDFKKDDFIALMKNDDFFNKMKEKYPDLLASAAAVTDVRYRLEGYLFPATYDYYKENSLESLVTQMVAKTNSVMSPYMEQITQNKQSIQEVLTLASLVEKEAVKEADRKNVAQVFFNRLTADMPLQSDISILYALGEHKEHVTYADLEVDSPYNLYTNKGFGPGPFNSPSENAILAVLEPTENDYYYFVADTSTGEVYFAKTYEEHLELVEKYVNN